MSPDETEQFERIEAVSRQAPPRPVQPGRRHDRRRLVWWSTGAAAVVVAAVALLVWLPGWLADPQVTTAVDTTDEAGARLTDQSERAERLRQQVYERWLELEGMDVSTWASVRAERALALLQEGERLAGELDHLGALRVLDDSNALLSELLDQAPAIAADRREAGWLAYRTGDAATAAAHFRVVLAIEPDDDAVREALQKTAYLGQVRTLMRRARDSEVAGDLDDALAALREVSRIDPGDTMVQGEIARLDAAQAAARFRDELSAVYRGINAGRFSAARAALRRAAALRPEAPEVRDAGIQIDVAVRAERTAQLRALARDAEAAEDWESAIGFYGELLQIDPALVLAQQGRDRARRLASLASRARQLLTDGEFFEADVRRRATTLLAQIETVEARAPGLLAMAARIDEALELALQPVTVRLRSDNQTDVVVFRVGRLGSFEDHEIELLPGRYTVVGSRIGYRDVRAELLVRAGQEPAPLEIRCEEQI